MLACRRIFTSNTVRNISKFHSGAAVAAENSGLFGKLNPWAKKEQEEVVTPAQHTDTQVTFNVRYQEEEAIESWKASQVMTDKSEIESVVKSAILQHVQDANETNWKDVATLDLDTKFKVLKESIKQTGKEVPNYQLDALKTSSDILDYFKNGEPVIKVGTVEEFFQDNETTLPKNLTFVPRA
ncbi:hypothetical protein K501DRAFT_336728 [Backusella circina FSU 941]|nr:hypothetical protein K501DRAFT_336728 [Backusella circina FSU 941]